MKRSGLFILALVMVKCTFSQQKHPDVLAYIEQHKAIAISEMHRTGVPAAIKLAQGIHETMAGKSPLVLRSNNHFGIKCKTNWAGPTYFHDDDARNECFRGYANAEESYIDHSNFLKNSARYHFLFQLDPTDYKGWAKGLKDAGYATNPKYPTLLISLIETYGLQDYTMAALNEIKLDMTDWAAARTASTTAARHTGGASSAADMSPVNHPYGVVFKVNETKAVYVAAGTSLLSIAETHHLPLRRLLDYNDFTAEPVIDADQLIYLQRKRKESHLVNYLVKEGESLHFIAQTAGIRLASLLEYNHLTAQQRPAPGEILYLKARAPVRPLLVEEAKARDEARQYAANTGTAGNHIVRTGDTLYSIAKTYGVSVEELQLWNQLPGSTISVGQTLIIKK